MDPNTGELWTQEQIDELRDASPSAADALEARLVTVEGTEEAVEQLSANVALGAFTRNQANGAAEVERMARERAQRAFRRQ